MLYLAIGAAIGFAAYTWTIAYRELRRRNYFGGLCLGVVGLLIAGIGLWEAFLW